MWVMYCFSGSNCQRAGYFLKIIDIISRECLLVAFVCKVLIFAYENLDFNEEIMVLMANRLGMKRKFER